MARISFLPILSTALFLQGLLFPPCTRAIEEIIENIGERILLVSSTSDIYISRGPVLDFNPLPLDVGRPEGIDYDENINMLFWTDSTARAIKRADLDSSHWTFVTSTGESPGDIAVDGNEELIFWASNMSNAGAITRVNYEGGDRRQIVGTGNTSAILSITLDKNSRTIYWTEAGNLQRATYEGLLKETLASGSIDFPFYGVVLNDDASRLFWCRRYFLRVMDLTQTDLESDYRGDYAGTLPSSCRRSASFEGNIYWTSDSDLMVRIGETGRVSVVASFQSSVPTDVYAGRRIVPGLHGGTCDFERIRCHWTFRNSMSDNLIWTRWSAELARTNSVGPTIDHTTQSKSGHYMLLNPDPEHSIPGNITTFFSPSVNAHPTECFRFWYYMPDVTNGSLKVYFEHEDQPEASSGFYWDELSLLWSAYGSQPDEWVGAEVEVKAWGVGRILIEAIVGDPSSNIIAIDDVEYGKCHQDSRLICEESTMTVYLDKARLGISSQDDVSFKNSLCRGVDQDADTVAITAPYNGCGTTFSESDDVILFSNQVNVMVRSGIRKSNVSIRVNCSFSRAYHVGMTYLAHAWIKHISEAGYGNFSVGIRQYSNADFDEAFSSAIFPQQVDVDDYIFMATEMVTVADLVDTHRNQRCWATPSANHLDPVNHDIIEDGCPVGNSTKVYTPPRAGLQPFSFKAFSFGQGVSLIYIHCDVIICHHSEESSCITDCNQSRSQESRGKRDAGSGPYTVSQGPFIYKTNGREDGAAPVNIILLSALVCMTVLLLATIFVGVFIHKRSRKGKELN